MIGKTIEIAVTSVLQTTAGKMIFGKFDERGVMIARPNDTVPAPRRPMQPQPSIPASAAPAGVETKEE
jgi:hypothetical protein